MVIPQLKCGLDPEGWERFHTEDEELTAALYKSPPRCFYCLLLGHRIYTCPSNSNGAYGLDRRGQVASNGTFGSGQQRP